MCNPTILDDVGPICWPRLNGAYKLPLASAHVMSCLVTHCFGGYQGVLVTLGLSKILISLIISLYGVFIYNNRLF